MSTIWQAIDDAPFKLRKENSMTQGGRVAAVTGEWECMECGYIEEGTQTARPAQCPECGASPDSLEFFSFDDDDEDEWEEAEEDDDDEKDEDLEAFDEDEDDFEADDDLEGDLDDR
jgi:hypothetical protein